jgi:hypothetical protein
MLKSRWVFLAVAICFLSGTSQSKTKSTNTKTSESEQVEVHVKPLQPGLDMSEFKEQGFTVDETENDNRKSEMVSAEDRELLFEKSGLAKDVSSWDNFEKDLFTMRSGAHPLKLMRKWYPKISETKIKKHQKLTAQLKGKK